MSTAPQTAPISEGADQVREILRAMPRQSAPYELTRSVRSHLFRERRHATPSTVYALWPAAAAVQLALLAGLCALYFFATPPNAIVVSESTQPAQRGAVDEPETGPYNRVSPAAP